MVSVYSPTPVPAGVLESFWRYDAALLANDHAVLDEMFLPGPDTLRGAGGVLLVGHDAIARFRSSRAVIPTRRVGELQVRVLDAGAVLIMARTEDGTGAGLQTQLWRLTQDGWRVAAAHVSAPARPAPAAFDRSVWRVVGAPLALPLRPGPLDGHHVAVKDLIAVGGHPVGGGVPAYLAEQPPQQASAPVVSALLRAGASLAGIAQTDEFAYSIAGSNSHYGVAPNPAAPDRLGGGSSSGPAAAVALGQAEIGLGTDTAGSIRVPAAYQGLVGFRPSHGAVASDGVLPLAPSFDTVGWLTRDIATCAAVARVLLTETAPRVADPVADMAPGAGQAVAAVATAGVADGWGFRALRLPAAERLAEPRTRALFARRVAALESAGALPRAEPADLAEEILEEWFAAFRTVQAYEAWQQHGAWIAAHPGVLGADVAERFAAAASVSAAHAAAARVIVTQARTRLGELLAGAVLVLPTAPGPGPLRTADAAEVDDVRARTLRVSCLAPLAGAPAVSLPLAGHDAPVGFCAIGAPGSDFALLSLAAALEGTP